MVLTSYTVPVSYTSVPEPLSPQTLFSMPMSAPAPPLKSMVAKAESLYTLPAVAMEVVRLTDNEKADARMLKQCIERDPALVAKLLKVVNSSLFGLSGKVENLNQAIALLGSKPLKLLVLGFSLPDGLLADIDAEQLQAYWRGALTRAIAARQLAESQWKMPGDDAFLVGLLQDIGMLVLLQQLGTPYARFLTQVRQQRERLVDLEQRALGFDHRELSIALMRNWHLPEIYVAAIVDKPAREATTGRRDATTIPQVLHLANLLAELVDEHRLQVLPNLLERGEQYCGMTKDDLSKLVAELEPQVARLADVLQVQLTGGETYIAVLAEAHQKLAKVAEDAAGLLMLTDDQICNELLTETRDLERAVQKFTMAPDRTASATDKAGRADLPEEAAQGPRSRLRTPAAIRSGAKQRLVVGVATATAACRQRREPLSLVVCEVAADDALELEIDMRSALQSAMQLVADDNDLSSQQIYPLTPTSLALVLPNVERREAVELAQQLTSTLATPSVNDSSLGLPLHLKAGAAHVAAIAKSFEHERLIEAAMGCLSAARAGGGSSVKSIEVY